MLNESYKLDINGICPYILKVCSVSLCAPLTYIFNLSLKSGLFPTALKFSCISPLFKSGDKCNVENYRPISKLTAIAKVFEHVVKAKLSFDVNKVLNPCQHGFVSGRSCLTNLSVFNSFISDSLLAHKQVDVIFTDFAKAFDRVSHTILLTKLSLLGFHSTFLSWFESYLSNRQCFVVVENCFSNSFIASSGVPQGSILGPLLFILFINDIGDYLKNSEYLLYADDLKLYRCVNSQSDMYLLQQDLNNLMSWCNHNQLFLNANKCSSMSFSKLRNDFPSSYSIDNCVLSVVSSVLDLGVVFDSKLLFNMHLDYIIPKAYSSLAFIRRHGSCFHDPYTLRTLYISLVRSKIEFASFIWNPYASLHVNRLERIQKSFTRLAVRPLFRNLSLPSYRSRALLLGISSLESRRSLFSIMFIYDLINGLIDCPCLLESLQFLVPPLHLRCNNVFYIPMSKTEYGKNIPIVRAQILINKLSRIHSIDFSISRVTFKSQLANIV